MEMLPVKRGILSVTDKSGLAGFAFGLVGYGVELISTGGTRKKLLDAGIEVKSVSEVTGFPEIMGGRVKTLHPNVHGGLLADKDNSEHMSTLDAHGIKSIDMVCVNLYNFAKAASDGLDLRSVVEQIDIGGPTMLRAAAKNFHSVLVIPSPEHYPRVLEEMSLNGGKVTLKLRKDLAAEAFAFVSEYDSMIAKYLADHDA